MLYAFKSQAAQDLLMLEEDAHTVMQLIGKPIQSSGIIIPEQLLDAIVRLQRAVDEDRISRLSNDVENKFLNETFDEIDSHIYLSQKLIPLLDMLHLAKNENKPVIWTEGNDR